MFADKVANVLTVGDLHLSDKYSRRHIDYFRDCQEHMEEITNVIKRQAVTHVILTGDVVGRTTEKNLENRESLLYFMKVFQVWNELTNGNVYVVRGNHDYGENITDFEMFVSLGYLKTADHIDTVGTRFHLINFGEHERELQLKEDDGLYHVAIMHTNLQVEGQTTWYVRGNDGVELSTLTNLKGVSMIIGGHIHNPSPNLVSTEIDGENIDLFYLGCATRPKFDANVWEKSYGVLFQSTEESVEYIRIDYDLRPAHEIFHKTFDDIVELEELEEEERSRLNVEELNRILDELVTYNIGGDKSYKEQIAKFGNADEEAVSLALKYIEDAEGVLRQ